MVWVCVHATGVHATVAGDASSASPHAARRPASGPKLAVRMSILEQVQADAAAALKAGERERARALRVVASELQKAAKEGGSGGGQDEEVGVLRRERKRRLEAADAYAEAGRDDLAATERGEAELIEAYLPAELSDEELDALVGDAVAETGASSAKEMGRVMSLVMPRVAGRADGRRVSAAVREKLTAA